jgi:hypothetical protein
MNVVALVVENQPRCYVWAQVIEGVYQKREAAEVFRIIDGDITISEGMWMFPDDFPTRKFNGVLCGDLRLTKDGYYIFPVSDGVERDQAETWEFDGSLSPIGVCTMETPKIEEEESDEEEVEIVIKRPRKP